MPRTSARFASPISAIVDDMLMIEPRPAAIMCGRTALATRKTTAHVDRHDPVPQLDRRLVEDADTGDPRVVEEHVDATEVRDDSRGKRVGSRPGR